VSAKGQAESKRQDTRLRAIGIKVGCDRVVHMARGKDNWIQPCSDPRCVFRGRRR
jgi:hypothetical protein